ncbi:MAG: cobalamin biosynthesis protein CobD [Acidimicrobiales bacterium]|nr:cobalamin biosynthesis protein CobD [Acidimicrobiales bacterium]
MSEVVVEGFEMKIVFSGVGVLGDAAIGEKFQGRFHPVGIYGKAMELVEKLIYSDEVKAGVLYLSIGIGLSSTPVLGLDKILGPLKSVKVFGVKVDRIIGIPLFLWLVNGGWQLGKVANQIGESLENGELDRAISELPSLVGRELSGLDLSQLSSAAIESVAENSVDALVAPYFYSTLFGAYGSVGYRGVNTLDAMVGKRNERYENFGKASARADDLLNYIPARLAAISVVALRPKRAFQIVKSIAKTSKGHPSPNSGVIEAAFAGALDIEIGGEVSYGGKVEKRPILGFGPKPSPSDIKRATKLLSDMELFFGIASVFSPLILPIAKIIKRAIKQVLK